MIRIAAITLAALLLCWPFYASPARADAGQKILDDRIANLFEEVVFGSEIDPRLASGVIAKWQQPIRIGVRGKPTARHLEFLRARAATLEKLTGLSIRVAANDEASNVTAVFVPRAQMTKIRIDGVSEDLIRKLAGPGGCYFISWQKPPGSIIGAVIVVNTDRDDAMVNHCLLEELTQSLGLPNDTDILRPSIFSDHDTLMDLSRTDEIVVRTLYDTRLKAGTLKAGTRQVVLPIIRELNARIP
ncbi:MAG: DUF2927 domain-containing protein [Alphaproteobacteria bacterium]|nr:DUF2927 domain-containing protein [Alphaproteobacteria bacterium]